MKKKTVRKVWRILYDDTRIGFGLGEYETRAECVNYIDMKGRPVFATITEEWSEPAPKKRKKGKR